jgi:hypothetical protein
LKSVGTNALVLRDELKAEPAVACCRPEGEQAAAWADSWEAIAAVEAILQSAKQEVSQIVVEPQSLAVCRLKEANVMQTNAGLLLNAERKAFCQLDILAAA